MNIKGKKIVFIGDSITVGYGLNEQKSRFTDLIAERTGAVCVNYGMNGTRIAHVTNEEDKGYFEARAEKMDDDADIVVVFGGVNDYGSGNAPIGTMADNTIYSFYGALHSLYKMLLLKYLGKRVVVFTPLHCGDENNPYGYYEHRKDRNTGVLKTYVEAIREVAEYYSLPLLDLYAVSGIQPNIKEIQDYYMPDGRHPNEAGHKHIAEIMCNFFENLN